MSITKYSQVAKRYADALFATVSETEHDATHINEEFKQIVEILGDPKVQSAFFHPKTSKGRKGELILLMRLSPITENFLLLLVEKSREEIIPSIAYHFEQLVLKSQQTTIAEVTSAIPLTEEVRTELELKLKKLTGKSVIVQTGVDPSIGGGMIVKVDGKVIDNSVNRTLKQFQRTLAN